MGVCLMLIVLFSSPLVWPVGWLVAKQLGICQSLLVASCFWVLVLDS